MPLPRFRLRTLMMLIVVVAAGLGAYLHHVRLREARSRLAGPIIAAADRGDTAMVRRYLDRGGDVNSIVNGRYPWTPLMHAAWRGHAGAVRLLIERGADLDHTDLDGFNALLLAAGEGHWGVVGLLVEAGATTARGTLRQDGARLRPGEGPPDDAARAVFEELMKGEVTAPVVHDRYAPASYRPLPRGWTAASEDEDT